MRIDVLTLFPAMFEGVLSASILGKAQAKGLVKVNTINFRDFATSKHHTVDDAPYGGGGGMVLKVEPIYEAIEHVIQQRNDDSNHTEFSSPPRIILLCPQGEPYTQRKAEELSVEQHLVFICGHYEGYDERIRQHIVTDEISIGDYVLMGGEIPAMVVIDSVVRLLPGVLGNEQSALSDSFSDGLLEYPHYTRPAQFRDWAVPDVLISGHHQHVAIWRREQSLLRTLQRRPDLLADCTVTEQERIWLEHIKKRTAHDVK